MQNSVHCLLVGSTLLSTVAGHRTFVECRPHLETDSGAIPPIQNEMPVCAVVLANGSICFLAKAPAPTTDTCRSAPTARLTYSFCRRLCSLSNHSSS